ncbi:hypothetical protein VTI74DRAFT_1931 [Chaetomium olivicolor]
MVASLRFSGLTEIDGNGSPLFSMNFEMPFFEEPETSRCIEWRVGRSRLRRVGGLNEMGQSPRVAFSWPRESAAAAGGTWLPESGEGPKTRFRGLLGEPRDRDKGRVIGLDLEERTESLMLGLTKGLAAVGSWGAEKDVGESSPAAGAGVAGIGEDAGCSNCATGEGVGDWRKIVEWAEVGEAADSLNLEGDRERDLLSDRTAELTSTW